MAATRGEVDVGPDPRAPEPSVLDPAAGLLQDGLAQQSDRHSEEGAYRDPCRHFRLDVRTVARHVLSRRVAAQAG
ncbi:MAG TPA: hypothetical protein VIP98_06340, partial [Microlunatus sp.]